MKSIFYRGRRPKLTGEPLVDLARLPLKPEVLARFVYNYNEEERDETAIDRFYRDIAYRIERLG